MSLGRGEAKVFIKEKTLLVIGQKSELGKKVTEFLETEALHAMELGVTAFQNLSIAHHYPQGPADQRLEYLWAAPGPWGTGLPSFDLLVWIYEALQYGSTLVYVWACIWQVETAPSGSCVQVFANCQPIVCEQPPLCKLGFFIAWNEPKTHGRKKPVSQLRVRLFVQQVIWVIWEGTTAFSLPAERVFVAVATGITLVACSDSPEMAFEILCSGSCRWRYWTSAVLKQPLIGFHMRDMILYALQCELL